MNITHDNLLVCQDCTMILANATLGNEDPDEDHRHLLRMHDRWGDDFNNLVLDSEYHDFATRHCDGCGSPLAGYRHEAVVLGVQSLNDWADSAEYRFIGSVYGGPIIAEMGGHQVFVSQSVTERLGDQLDADWIVGYWRGERS